MDQERVKALLRKHMLEGVNKPKRTPSHPEKAGIVLARENGVTRLIRFGQQGVKRNQTVGQREAFESRHAKNIAKGKLSPGYWAAKFLWDSKKTQSPSKKWVKGS